MWDLTIWTAAVDRDGDGGGGDRDEDRGGDGDNSNGGDENSETLTTMEMVRTVETGRETVDNRNG
jgi:hypothetical protein